MTSAIHIHNVSKWFDRFDSPNQRLLNFFRRRVAPAHRFHALRDINIDIPKGSAFGLLGRNGAGKSTLMQMVAGVMQPSIGHIHVDGRISPLLELGTGFNPEYTGIENVRLNAAVLGLSASEIRQKEQLIADFADIGEFIDRPVKTYSSGMFARLAFAVAISVDPEILLVDEILAVGDMGFQQKCLSKLREMREEGLTLIFVSHSPDAVKSVCNKAVFLDHGSMMYVGEADQAVDRYLAFVREQSNQDQLKLERDHPWKRPVARRTAVENELRYGSGHVQIVRSDILGADGSSTRTFIYGERVKVEIEIESAIDVQNLCVNLLVRDANGLDLFGTSTFDERISMNDMCAGDRQVVRFEFPVVTRLGTYGLTASVTRLTYPDYSDVFLFDQAEGICSYSVAPTPDRPVHYKFHIDTEISAHMVEHNASRPAFDGSAQ